MDNPELAAELLKGRDVVFGKVVATSDRTQYLMRENFDHDIPVMMTMGKPISAKLELNLTITDFENFENIRDHKIAIVILEEEDGKR
jgi:hypothetical protein